MPLNNIKLPDIVKAMNRKGYAFFENDSKPFNLNIIGIRSEDNTPNVFNDLITVSWRFKNNWNFLKFAATTDPGLYWLEHPMNTLGTAVLAKGQYRSSHVKRKHRGDYYAVCQKGELTVLRNGVPDKGKNFGINIHRANAKKESIIIDKWSAGCQVLANPHEFDLFMTCVDEAIECWSNSFTYTLLLEEEI